MTWKQVAWRRVVVLVALALLSGACFPAALIAQARAARPSGTPIDNQAALALDDSPQTREDVRRQFGEPLKIEFEADGIETWHYHYLSKPYRIGPDARRCAIQDWIPIRVVSARLGSTHKPCPPRMRMEQTLTVSFHPSGQVQDVAYALREVADTVGRRGSSPVPTRPPDPRPPATSFCVE